MYSTSGSQPSPTGEHVSYLVAPELRGQGLASRAVAALLTWGTSELGLLQAIIHCDVENIASQRVAEKCGFVLVGRFGGELRFKRDLWIAGP